MQALAGNCTLGRGVVAPPVQLVPEAFHSPNSARALCSIRRRDYARCFTCKSCKCVYAYPLFPNRQNVVALLFTCKSCKIVQAHPFFPNRNRGYARLLACKSCKLVQACRFPEMGKGVCPHLYTQVLPIYAGEHLFSQNVDRGYALLFTCQSYKLVQAYPLFPQERNRGIPVYLHAALKTYAGIPLFPRNGKRDAPICLHANLPNLRNHMFPAVHVFLSHAGLANGCRHTPLFPEREKGIDLDISLAILADRCQHTYFSRK